jgi:hypothetical protein
MTFATIRSAAPSRSLQRARRLLAVFVVAGTLTAGAGGVTYALGADIVGDAASRVDSTPR